MAKLKDARQEAFAKLFVKGRGIVGAYMEAFPDAAMLKEDVVEEKARELYADKDVMSRIDEMQQGLGSNGVIDPERRMAILSGIAMDEDMHPKQRMAAIDILNKMDNIYVKKIEAEVSTRDLKDAADAVAAILDE